MYSRFKDKITSKSALYELFIYDYEKYFKTININIAFTNNEINQIYKELKDFILNSNSSDYKLLWNRTYLYMLKISAQYNGYDYVVSVINDLIDYCSYTENVSIEKYINTIISVFDYANIPKPLARYNIPENCETFITNIENLFKYYNCKIQTQYWKNISTLSPSVLLKYYTSTEILAIETFNKILDFNKDVFSTITTETGYLNKNELCSNFVTCYLDTALGENNYCDNLINDLTVIVLKIVNNSNKNKVH